MQRNFRLLLLALLFSFNRMTWTVDSSTASATATSTAVVEQTETGSIVPKFLPCLPWRLVYFFRVAKGQPRPERGPYVCEALCLLDTETLSTYGDEDKAYQLDRTRVFPVNCQDAFLSPTSLEQRSYIW